MYFVHHCCLPDTCILLHHSTPLLSVDDHLQLALSALSPPWKHCYWKITSFPQFQLLLSPSRWPKCFQYLRAPLPCYNSTPPPPCTLFSHRLIYTPRGCCSISPIPRSSWTLFFGPPATDMSESSLWEPTSISSAGCNSVREKDAVVASATVGLGTCLKTPLSPDMGTYKRAY